MSLGPLSIFQGWRFDVKVMFEITLLSAMYETQRSHEVFGQKPSPTDKCVSFHDIVFVSPVPVGPKCLR